MTTESEVPAKQTPFLNPGEITTAVVTGGHPYDVPAFHHLLRSLKGVDCYLQHLNNFVFDLLHVQTQYDVILFYNFTLPGYEQVWWHDEAEAKQALGVLGETSQGIVILHHALGAFPDWDFWSDLVGIPHEIRTFSNPFDLWEGQLAFDQLRHFEIADPNHPIVQGLQDWDMYGETWGELGKDPAPGCPVLLTSDHSKMQMRTMAWTNQFKKARVFCLQPGHDKGSWAEPNFRTVLQRGILWAAGRL